MKREVLDDMRVCWPVEAAVGFSSWLWIWSGARKSRKASKGSKSDHRHALADICLRKPSVQHCLLIVYYRDTIFIARTILASYTLTSLHSTCASQNWPQAAFASHYCRPNCSVRSPIEVTGEAHQQTTRGARPAIWLPRNVTLFTTDPSYLVSSLTFV